MQNVNQIVLQSFYQSIYTIILILRETKKNHDRRLSENCVTMVKHLMIEEENILSFADFHETFPNVGLDFLTHHGLVSSIMT